MNSFLDSVFADNLPIASDLSESLITSPCAAVAASSGSFVNGIRSQLHLEGLIVKTQFGVYHSNICMV